MAPFLCGLLQRKMARLWKIYKEHTRFTTFKRFQPHGRWPFIVSSNTRSRSLLASHKSKKRQLLHDHLKDISSPLHISCRALFIRLWNIFIVYAESLLVIVCVCERMIARRKCHYLEWNSGFVVIYYRKMGYQKTLCKYLCWTRCIIQCEIKKKNHFKCNKKTSFYLINTL